MTDIVEEARNPDSSAYQSPAHYAARLEGLCQELADEIERLRQVVLDIEAIKVASYDEKDAKIERLRCLLGAMLADQQVAHWHEDIRAELGEPWPPA